VAIFDGLKFLVFGPARAADDDVWFHHWLTNSEVKRGALNHPKCWENAKSACPRRAFIFSPIGKYEISGRLRSRADSVEAYATSVADKRKAANQNRSSHEFRGASFGRVHDLRSIESAQVEVYCTPDDDDTAHSDLVLSDVQMISGEVSREVWADLRDAMTFAAPGSVELRNQESQVGVRS